jgi:cell division protein FtsB
MIYKRKRNFLEKLGSLKFLTISGLAFLVFISVGLSKEIVRRHQINKEIEKVKKEIEVLEKKNQELSSIIDYLSTESFREIQARKELGFQKEGETAISIQSEEAKGEEVKKEEQNKEISNPKKWWNYFFASG